MTAIPSLPPSMPSGRARQATTRLSVCPTPISGVLMQGDSLSIIRGDIAEVVEACAQGDVDDAHEAATLLLATFDELLARYESALEAHGIKRPY
ncbi:DUF6959 family protein [Streptomyces sp. NPDC055796]